MIAKDGAPDSTLALLPAVPATVASGFVFADVRRRPTAGWLAAAGS